jgi:hypothetical protein
MVVTSTFRLAKKIHGVEQHERDHLKPYFCKIKMKRHYNTTKIRGVT